MDVNGFINLNNEISELEATIEVLEETIKNQAQVIADSVLLEPMLYEVLAGKYFYEGVADKITNGDDKTHKLLYLKGQKVAEFTNFVSFTTRKIPPGDNS